jgi:threonylcarbamoyladenosine tRNA methylthiotransferase MtaB
LIGKLCRVKITEAGVNECHGKLVRVLDELPAEGSGTELNSFTPQRPEAIRA